MNNSYFSSTQLWRIPQAAIEDSLDEMAFDGDNDHEGIVLWLGKDIHEIAEVTHLVRIRGPLVEKRKDFINIDPAILNDVADVAMEHGIRLVGQVHSHGPSYGVDLSLTDHIYGIRAPFYLSLVAPDYALTRAPLYDWGVHVYSPEVGYIRLSDAEVRHRLQIIGGLPPPMLTIGG